MTMTLDAQRYHAGGVKLWQVSTVLFGVRTAGVGIPAPDVWAITFARRAKRCIGGNILALHRLYAQTQMVTLQHKGFSPHKGAFNLGGLR